MSKQNFIRIGDKAPDFDAQSQNGKFNFHEYLGKSWGVLFSHPADFTPVCATELGRVAQLKAEWAKRDVKVCGLSVDSVGNHQGWIKDINEIAKTTVDYPVIADPERQVAALYGMLSSDHMSAKGLPLTVRSVFVLDPAKIVKLIITYPASTGRSFTEILRVIDSLQLTVNHKLATPADWNNGDDAVVVPSIATKEAKTLFDGVREVRPWLRMAKDPRKEKSLWDRLGGDKVIKPMVGAIYDLHASDPLSADYFGPHKFANTGKADYVKEQVLHFFSAGIGGPYKYSGKDMVKAHQGMVISEAAFHAVAYHVMTSMKKFGAGGDQEREEVLAILNSLKPSVQDYTKAQGL